MIDDDHKKIESPTFFSSSFSIEIFDKFLPPLVALKDDWDSVL